MKSNCLLALAVLVSMLGCQAPTPSPKGSSNEASTQDSELRKFMDSQIDAMNKKDIRSYMATIDPSANFYKPTEAMLASIYKSWDLKVTLDSFQVQSKQENEAKIRTVISTIKVSGPKFKDNTVTALHTLVKKNGQWLITRSDVEKMEYIKG